MIGHQLSREAPELIALCRVDDAGIEQVVGWAMMVAERVVAYVPERRGAIGTGLLNTYSSLDAADRMLAYAGIRPVLDWTTQLNAADAH